MQPPFFSMVDLQLGQSCVLMLSQLNVSLSSAAFFCQVRWGRGRREWAARQRSLAAQQGRTTMSQGAGACASACLQPAQKL